VRSIRSVTCARRRRCPPAAVHTADELFPPLLEPISAAMAAGARLHDIAKTASSGTSSMVSGAPRIACGWVSPDHAKRVIADRDPALTDLSGARLGTRWRSASAGFRPARPRGRHKQDQAAGSLQRPGPPGSR